MNEQMVRGWFNEIMTHAKANYERDGWDCFVECVEFTDFLDTCEHMKLDTYEKAFTEYEEWCGAKADQREEQWAEADSGW